MDKEEFLRECEIKIKNFHENFISSFLDDRIYNLLPQFAIEYCLSNKEAQEKIVKMTDTQLDIFNKIVMYATNYNQDWIPNAANFINCLENSNYTDLFISLEGKNLSLGEIENLIFLTNNYSNFFKVNKYDDLQSVESYQDIAIAKYKTDDPNIILLTKYGLSYDKANNYLKRYGKDLNKLPDGIEKQFLIDIRNIISGKGTSNRKHDNIEFINNLNSHLRNFFTSIYNKELYQINESNYMGAAYFNGVDIPLYDAGTEFTMSIYSYGLAATYNEPDNFYEDWNRPIEQSINFCNSIITDSSMHTTIKHCVYGFSSFAYNDIQLISPNDLGTGGVEGNPNVTNFYHKDKLIADVSFRIPSEMVNYTRTTNNEIYRSRKTLVNGKLQRVNPDYIVYLKESSETDIQNDPIWRKTTKAAYQFGHDNKPIPIVIIDCEECLKANLKKIDNQIEQFTSRYDDISSLQKIVEHIFTLRAGYKRNDKLVSKYLNQEVVMSYFNTLLNHIIKTSEVVPNIALVNINTLISTIDLEHVKTLASPYWIRKYEAETNQKIEKPKELYEILCAARTQIEQRIAKLGYKEEFLKQ